jgi:hypothetical protein
MKALTLTQPWASLVIIGAKKIETRSWSIRHRGLLAIHAAKGFPAGFSETDAAALCFTKPFRKALMDGGIEAFGQLPRGAVLGVVELKDVKPIADDLYPHSMFGPDECQLPPDEPERSFGDYRPGRFAWLLEVLKRFDEPIVARGAQKDWQWEPPHGLLRGIKLGVS